MLPALIVIGKIRIKNMITMARLFGCVGAARPGRLRYFL